MKKQTTDFAAVFINTDIEEKTVIGMLLNKYFSIDDMSVNISESNFNNSLNKEIFAAIYEQYRNGKPIEIFDVAMYLQSKQVKISDNFANYVVFLMQYFSDVIVDFTKKHIDVFAQILIEKNTANKIKLLAYNMLVAPDAASTISDSEEIMRVLNDIAIENNEVRSIKIVAKESLDKACNPKKYKKNRVFSGLYDLDNKLEGLNTGELSLIAARPGMGKTAFALELTKRFALKEAGVLYFILESKDSQLVDRMMLSGLKMSSYHYKFEDKSDDEIEQIFNVYSNLADLNVHFVDQSDLTTDIIRKKVKRMKAQYDIKVVIIDYLQLITPKNRYLGNKNNEIGEISRELVNIAKESDCAIIALSQLNRSVETRGGGKKPMLSDLRDSGNLEQDAAKIMFLYRPAYYITNENPDVVIDDSEDRILEVIISKNRDAGLGTVKLYHDTKISNFGTVPFTEVIPF